MDSECKRRMSPSLSLITVASLTPVKHEVYIEDENIQKINYQDRPDLVGITVNVNTSSRAYKIAKKYRKKGVPVIFGGIHVSANPDEALLHGDSVCIGEAEEVWPRVIADLQKGRLKVKYFSSSPGNLENIPIPRWELINKSKYLYTNIICSSRGCPFRCDFCYNSSSYIHNQFRNRPIEKVVEEIKHLGTKQIMFIDDNFIGNLQWTKKFIKRIAPLKLTWHAAVTVNIVNDLELLDSVQLSGCKSLFIGFESINKYSIKSVHKQQNKIEMYDKLIKECHKREIMVNASIAFGFDHDTKDVFKNTIDWLVKNKVETMTAHILTPYPGTRLHKKLHDEDRIIDHNKDNYNTAHVVFEPKNMTKEELYKGYIWAYKNFYSFKNILKRMPKSKQRRMSYLLFNLGYRKFGKITSMLGKLGLMNYIGKIGRKLAYNIE